MNKIKEFFIEFFPLMIITVVISIFLRNYVLGLMLINGRSMEPTYQNKDFVLVDKLSYRFNKPDYNHIVIVKTDKGATKSRLLVKRIEGLPGDELEIKNGDLFRNQQKVEEDYIKAPMEKEMEKIKLGPDEYFFMGDNRNSSLDSREIGPVKKSDIIGKVTFKIYGK